MILLFWSISGAAEEMPALDCVITPSMMVNVSSSVPGTLAEVSVDRSDVVLKGQVLARLNSQIEQATVHLARAKAELDSEINIGKVNVLFDEEKYNRFDSLYFEKVASSQDKDDFQRNLALSKEKLRHARELRKLRQLELLKAEAQLNQKIIRSPIDGVVVQRFRSKSEYIEDQPVVRIAQFNPLHVEAIVPMAFFGQINSGMQANVFSEIFPESPQRATVIVTDQMGDAASGTFGVRLELPNPDNKLPAGIKCNVQILPDIPSQKSSKAMQTTESSRIKSDSPEGALPISPLIAGNSEAPLALDADAATVMPMCLTLGPYDSAADADQSQRVLGDKAYAYSLREDPPRISYVVLLPKQETIEQSQQLIARMRKAGVEDLAIVSKGQYKGKVSAGIYRSQYFYKRRISQLADLGFESKAYPLVKKSGKWWLDIDQSDSGPDSTSLRELLSGLLDGQEIKTLACSKA